MECRRRPPRPERGRAGRPRAVPGGSRRSSLPLGCLYLRRASLPSILGLPTSRPCCQRARTDEVRTLAKICVLSLFRGCACVRRRPHGQIMVGARQQWAQDDRCSTATFPEPTMSAHMTPEQVRSKIDHPIVDGDGHWVEYDPVFSEKMRKVGGDLAADGFLKAMGTTRELLSLSVAERRNKRLAQQAFWARQAENTLDRATAMMPKLLYDRLDEIGLDFAIIYPTAGLRFPRIADDATRRAVIRAYNIVSADYFRD